MLILPRCLLIIALCGFIPLPLQAGPYSWFKVGQSSKCCDSAPEHQPVRCRPKITRPCTYHSPQPRSGCAKPASCYQVECGNNGCCPVSTDCAPALTAGNCDLSCISSTAPPELTRLIQASQTATPSWRRRDAVHRLSDKYDCRNYPDVMNALLFALNDPDERVRSKAADEIGDQLRVNPCCCSCTVLEALKYSLGDCDRFVRRQAEEALLAAGYEVVDGCCQAGAGCSDVGCTGAFPATFNAASPSSASPTLIPASEMAAPRAPASVPVNDRAPAGSRFDNPIAPPPAELPFPSPSADRIESGKSSSNDAPVPAPHRVSMRQLKTDLFGN